MPKNIPKRQKTSPATPDKKVKARSYDNTSRNKKSKMTEKMIIETMVDMLVERRGGEVQIDELARASKISERTIFRFFKDKTALHEATNLYLQNFLQSSVTESIQKDIVGFAENVFLLFERNENLVMAYLYSPFGLKARELYRKKLNRVLIEQIMKDNSLIPSRTLETKLAVIVGLVSAKVWHDIRIDFGHSSLEIGKAGAWAIKTLIKNLK